MGTGTFDDVLIEQIAVGFRPRISRTEGLRHLNEGGIPSSYESRLLRRRQLGAKPIVPVDSSLAGS